MASTLYILLPSKAVARASPDWMKRARPFALVSDDGAIVQQGQQTLAELRGLAMIARQVTLLLAASDVSLMTVKVPSMSAAKLKTALPNLIEDQLLEDSSELILLSNAPVNGMCTIAAVDRSWMEFLHAQMQIIEAKKLTAYSLSMTISTDSDAMTAIIEPDEQVTELAFRHAGRIGAGLTVNDNLKVGAFTDAAEPILKTLSLFATDSQVKVFIPADYMEIFQQLVKKDDALAQHFNFQALEWKTRISGLSATSIDLMSSVSHDNQLSFDWGKWRWSLGLAAAAAILNLAGLNFQWLSMKREAQGLSDSLVQTYRTNFPKETVILDPLAQMQQKINLSRKIAGQSTQEDFLVLAAQFAQVWDMAIGGKQPAPSVVSMEYKEHSLLVKTKATGLLPLEQLRTGLQEHVLILVSSTDGVLQVKSGRGERK